MNHQNSKYQVCNSDRFHHDFPECTTKRFTSNMPSHMFDILYIYLFYCMYNHIFIQTYIGRSTINTFQKQQLYIILWLAFELKKVAFIHKHHIQGLAEVNHSYVVTTAKRTHSNRQGLMITLFQPGSPRQVWKRKGRKG